jgi:hypothetical protein
MSKIHDWSYLIDTWNSHSKDKPDQPTFNIQFLVVYQGTFPARFKKEFSVEVHRTFKVRDRQDKIHTATLGEFVDITAADTEAAEAYTEDCFHMDFGKPIFWRRFNAYPTPS